MRKDIFPPLPLKPKRNTNYGKRKAESLYIFELPFSMENMRAKMYKNDISHMSRSEVTAQENLPAGIKHTFDYFPSCETSSAAVVTLKISFP